MGGAEEHGEPSVGDLAGQLEVARAYGGQVDRDLLAHRVHRQPQRLSRAIGQRQRPVLTVVGQPLAAQSLANDVDVLARTTQWLVEPHAVPAFGDLRPGQAESEAEPPAGQRVERCGGHGGRRRGARRDLHDGAADVDAFGVRGDVGQHGRCVRPVRLRRPDDGITEPVSLLCQGEVVPVGPSTPIAEVQSEPHASSGSVWGRGEPTEIARVARRPGRDVIPSRRCSPPGSPRRRRPGRSGSPRRRTRRASSRMCRPSA